MNQMQKWYFIVLLLAAAAIVVTFIVLKSQRLQNSQQDSQQVKKWLLALWTLIPPLWFWAEFFFVNPPAGDAYFDRYKYGQELSKNVWAAVVALLLVFYFREHKQVAPPEQVGPGPS